MGYLEDDSYTEDSLAEMIKLHPGMMHLNIVGVAVHKMKNNPISIDAKKIKKRIPLFGRNKK